MTLSRAGSWLALLLMVPWLWSSELVIAQDVMAQDVRAQETGRPSAEALEAARRNPPRSICKVGRRFYCDKYLGVCQQHGTGERDCDAWYQGCVTCHEESSACSAGLRTGSQACGACGTAFSVCMRANYKATWIAQYQALSKP